MDEETGNQKREAGLGPDRGSPELEGPDISMGMRQVSSGSWMPCPHLVVFTDTGGVPPCSSVRSDHSCPISGVYGLRGAKAGRPMPTTEAYVRSNQP